MNKKVLAVVASIMTALIIVSVGLVSNATMSTFKGVDVVLSNGDRANIGAIEYKKDGTQVVGTPEGNFKSNSDTQSEAIVNGYVRSIAHQKLRFIKLEAYPVSRGDKLDDGSRLVMLNDQLTIVHNPTFGKDTAANQQSALSYLIQSETSN